MKTPARLSPRTVLLAIVCNLLWAGAYVTGKQAIGTPGAAGFGAFGASFWRFLLAGVLLLIWNVRRGGWRSVQIARADWPRFGRLALLGMCLTYVFNYQGLAWSTGTAAALIMATEPVWIALLAVLVLRERLTVPRFAGIVLGLAGTLLVVLSTQRNGASSVSGGISGSPLVLIGNLLMVASLLWESLAVLTVKRLTERYPGPVIVNWEFLIGSVLLAPFAFAEWWVQHAHGGATPPSATAWWAFAYLVTGCTLVAYTVWYWLLETVDASALTVFIFLQPVVGTLLGVLWLHDPFTVWTAVGAALVVAGMGCIMRAERAR